MSSLIKCPKHNLPEQMVCTGEFCPKRIGCELCIGRHDHKFYLDSKNREKNVVRVRRQVQQKLQHLNNYTSVNVKTLKLPLYHKRLQQQIDQERLCLQNKLKEERINFDLWMEKTQKAISQAIEKLESTIMNNWEYYNVEAQRHLNSQSEYKQLMDHFQVGDWTTHEHVEQSVNFLYSEELLFRFNRSLDRLKKEINHHKKQNQSALGWFYTRRNMFPKYQLCPSKVFEDLLEQYQHQPAIDEYKREQTKQSRDDQRSVISFLSSETKALMIYPKIIYEPFQNIDKLIRYNNNLFATSGGRSLNLWTRVSMSPEKSYPLDFPSYGISTFREAGQDDPQILLYGKANGQLGLINVQQQTVKQMDAHKGAVKEIIQFDEYHFMTASYDWSIRLWGMNRDSKDPNFAQERLELKGSSGKVHCLCKFGPSVLSAGADNIIRLWDVMRGAFDETFTHEKEVHSLLEVRPEFFASGGELRQLRVWDYRKTKSPLLKFPVEHGIDSMLKYDENTIIFNDKNVVKVVDIRNHRQPILRFQNKQVYSHAINSMQFLSDVEIGMGGSDGFVTLWKY